MKRDIRVIAIGEGARLPAPVRRVLNDTIRLTACNRGMTVVLALSYGGRQDVVEAARRIAEAVASGRITPEQVDEPMLQRELLTGDIPDPDLLIRTSGELRLSNFLLFQLAYTELYFTSTLWPDFSERDFLRSLVAYQTRTRRFGMVDEGASISLSAANQA